MAESDPKVGYTADRMSEVSKIPMVTSGDAQQENADMERYKKDEAFQVAVNKGWDMMTPGSHDKVRNNVMCQGVAMAAGAVTLFFASFSEFSKAMVDMPNREIKNMKEMESLRKDSIEAYQNTYLFSVDYAKALQTLGMFQGKIPAVQELIEMYGEADEVAPQEDVRVALCMDDLSASLEVLSKGADDQVKRAFEVVAKAMQVQATGNAWEARLNDEQNALAQYETAQADFIACKTNASYLSNEGNLVALNGKKKCLEATLERVQKLYAENHAGRKKAFDDMKMQYEKDKDDAVSFAEIRRKAWDEDYERRLKACADAVEAAQKVVSAGGYKTTVTNMEDEVTVTGWFWKERWATRRPITNETCDLPGAERALKDAIENQQKVTKETNPHDPTKAEAPQLPDWKQFKGSEDEETADIAAKKKEIAEIEGEIKENEMSLDAHQKKITAAEVKAEKAKDKWVEMQKALNDDFGDDIGTDYQKKLIQAYKAGQTMQQAISISGYIQETATNSMLMETKALNMLVKAVCAGKTADSQGKRLSKLAKLADPQGETDMATMLTWLKKVGGLFMPLPAPEGVTREHVEDAFQKQQKAKKALEDDKVEDDKEFEVFDAPLFDKNAPEVD